MKNDICDNLRPFNPPRYRNCRNDEDNDEADPELVSLFWSWAALGLLWSFGPWRGLRLLWVVRLVWVLRMVWVLWLWLSPLIIWSLQSLDPSAFGFILRHVEPP